ncbi:hypothetical protein CTheo_9112 [Ceratobasidium theobromae]|uniref:Uncharacterized protein n=1 Tax=Ceratobasidium theobromae TaxID=1582974 RepID=A0A5N5Q6A0_9AGAM|nr:hypothetical protein CTheo_9112 [Ceratobasidium theobromae]
MPKASSSKAISYGTIESPPPASPSPVPSPVPSPSPSPSVAQISGSPLASKSYTIPTESTSLAGVFTDETLRILNLGLLVEYGILYCLDCPIKPGSSYGITNTIKAIKSHLSECHRRKLEMNKPVLKAIKAVAENYKAWDGNQKNSPIPIPPRVIAPIPWLPLKTNDGPAKKNATQLSRCALCTKRPFVFVQLPSWIRHRKKTHNIKDEDQCPDPPQPSTLP